MLSRRHLLSFTRRCSFQPRSHFHSSSILFAKRKVIERFRLADIGEGITECEVIKWSVKPNSVIQSFDPLCEVQSDKASVEITSPFDGTITELLVPEGAVAKVGEGLCLIEVEVEEGEAVVAAATEPTVVSESVAHTATQPVQVPHEPPQATQARSTSNLHPLDPSRSSTVTLRSDILATPSVRHFAKQKGVELASIGEGSGKGGRIEKKDVEAFLSPKVETTAASVVPEDSDQEVVLGRTRFAMWKAMTKSLEIPHFGYSTTLDLTKLSELLPTLNAHIPNIYLSSPPEDLKSMAVSPYAIFSDKPPVSTSDPRSHYTHLTVLPLLLKTLSRAMLEWPLFRSSITFAPSPSSADKPIVTVRPHADISIALSTPTGLYTPTLLSVDTTNPYQIMGRLRRLQNLGRQVPCALGPSDMPKRGGTLTVSNVGAIGQGEFASPVLVPGGGVAIVAIGKARWVDVVPQDGVGPAQRRLQVGISWSADHRVVEGAELAAFVECWRSWVEKPERLVGEGI